MTQVAQLGIGGPRRSTSRRMPPRPAASQITASEINCETSRDRDAAGDASDAMSAARLAMARATSAAHVDSLLHSSQESSRPPHKQDRERGKAGDEGDGESAEGTPRRARHICEDRGRARRSASVVSLWHRTLPIARPGR